MMTTETMLVTLGDMKDSLQQMTELRDGIRAEMGELLPAINKLETRDSLLQRRVEYLNSSIMNLETYLTLEKGDADAN